MTEEVSASKISQSDDSASLCFAVGKTEAKEIVGSWRLGMLLSIRELTKFILKRLM